MLGRILALSVVAGCYTVPTPDCGFVCGPSFECPSGYHCAGDGRCHRDGTPDSLKCLIPDARQSDSDTGQPFVIARLPEHAVTNVDVSTQVIAEFSEQVMGVDAISFRVGDGAGSVPASVGYDSLTKSAILTPFAPLSGNVVHTPFLLSALIRDLSGNPVLEPTWSFTTGPESVAPSVISTDPPDLATNVGAMSSIRVLFSEPVINVTDTTFIVEVNAAVVMGTYVVADARTIEWLPDADYPPGATVVVTLNPGITDNSGNGLLATMFSFQAMN